MVCGNLSTALTGGLAYMCVIADIFHITRTPPPKSFQMCVEQAYLSAKAAIEAGHKLLEVHDFQRVVARRSSRQTCASNVAQQKLQNVASRMQQPLHGAADWVAAPQRRALHALP